MDGADPSPPAKADRISARGLLAVAAVAAAVGVAVGGGVAFLAYRQLSSTPSAPVVNPGGGGGSSQGTSLSSVVAAVAPSVVQVVREHGTAAPTPATVSDGFVASSTGLGVTSEAAVAGASGVEVVLASGVVLPATIASSDPHTGIVLLQVSSSSLPPALGFSQNPALGSTAIAVSTSLGGSVSVDVGSISQLGITASVSDPTASGGSVTWDGMMRTDVPEPPGSSGAPLVNSSGQVVGILAGTRMVPSDSGSGYFALDAFEAAYLASAIGTNGAGPPPVGLVTQYLTPATAAALQLPAGAQVLAVDPGSAAAAAGLKVGDVVVQVDGSAVQGSGAPRYPDLADLLTALGPGAQVALSVQEGGQRHTVTLTVPVG